MISFWICVSIVLGTGRQTGPDGAAVATGHPIAGMRNECHRQRSAHSGSLIEFLIDQHHPVPFFSYALTHTHCIAFRFLNFIPSKLAIHVRRDYDQRNLVDILRLKEFQGGVWWMLGGWLGGGESKHVATKAPRQEAASTLARARCTVIIFVCGGP